MIGRSNTKMRGRLSTALCITFGLVLAIHSLAFAPAVCLAQDAAAANDLKMDVDSVRMLRAQITRELDREETRVTSVFLSGSIWLGQRARIVWRVDAPTQAWARGMVHNLRTSGQSPGGWSHLARHPQECERLATALLMAHDGQDRSSAVTAIVIARRSCVFILDQLERKLTNTGQIGMLGVSTGN